MSITAMIGIFSLRASRTAMRSFFGSTMKIASGRRCMSLMPPRKRSSLFISSWSFATSFLGRRSKSPWSLHVLELAQTRDALLDRREVGQRAAEPALVDEERAGALGLFANDVLRLLLGADEQNDFALARHLLDDFVGFAQLLHGEREIDDVDAVALLEDERLHLGVPAAGLVAEVDACLEQLAHGDDGHEK